MAACEDEIGGKGAPAGLMPILAAVNGALNYLKFIFSQKCISSLFARKFQYLYQIKNPYGIFLELMKKNISFSWVPKKNKKVVVKIKSSGQCRAGPNFTTF